MAKHVLLSFVEEDIQLVNLFRGQAKNKNSNLEFSDYSVHTPYNSTNATYIRSQIADRIRSASVTIVLVGRTTYTSDWVGWEIDKSYELGNRVLGVRLSSTPAPITPARLPAHGATVLNWDIDAIVRAIG